MMIHINTGMFHGRQDFEAEFNNDVNITGKFNVSHKKVQDEQKCEKGSVLIPEAHDHTIELYDIKAVLFGDLVKPTKEMKREIITFLEAQDYDTDS